MHLIPRRAARRVLVLLLAMGGLLAVPALAFAHSDLSLIKVVDHAQAAPGDLLDLHDPHPEPRHAPQCARDGHRRTARAHDVREQLGGLHRRRRPSSPARSRPVAIGQVVTITITVRVDDNVPAGDLVNIADVTTPADSNHGQQPRLGRHDGRLRRPRRLRLVGSEPRRPADRRRARLRRRHACIIYDASGTLVGTTTTDATGLYRFDHLRPDRRPTRSASMPPTAPPGGPLAGFELTSPNAGSDDAIDSDGVLAQRRAVHHPGADRRGGLVRPDLRLRLLEAGARSATASGTTPITTASRTPARPASAASASTLHDATGATIGTTTTDANGLYLFDRLNAGTYKRLLRRRDDPVRLRPHDEERPGLDARERLRRRRQTAAPTRRCSRRVSATSTGTPASGRRRPRRPPAGGSSGAVSGKPKLALKKIGKPVDRARRRRASTTR